MEQQYPSVLLRKAVNEFSKLPGIGRKTALRLVLHLLRRSNSNAEQFASTIAKMRQKVKHCQVRHNISDEGVCPICLDLYRNTSLIYAMENIQDVITMESTQQFRGLYHVLRGTISPMDGIGPGQLEMQSLVQRIEQSGVSEMILTLSSMMRGDTTNFYISRKLVPLDVRLSVIARGISVGDELECTDEVALGRLIVNRTPFER